MMVTEGVPSTTNPKQGGLYTLQFYVAYSQRDIRVRRDHTDGEHCRKKTNMEGIENPIDLGYDGKDLKEWGQYGERIIPRLGD